jgi:hypothetical protein
VEYSPFYGIEKGAVLQEARCFNDAHVDPRRCQQVITKLLYLLTQGESFTKVRLGGVSCRAAGLSSGIWLLLCQADVPRAPQPGCLLLHAVAARQWFAMLLHPAAAA